MNYVANTNCVANCVAEDLKNPPLYEQLNVIGGTIEKLCGETSKLLDFVCTRTVEPCELQGKELSARLSWMYNTIQRCIDALKDVNEVVR